MNEKLYEIKKFLGFSLGPFINFIIGFISVPITTRILAPDQFGKATFYSTVTEIAYLLLTLSLYNGFSRFYIEETDKKKLLRNSILIPVILWAIITLSININRNYFSQIIFGTDDSFFILLMSAQLFFQIIVTFSTEIIRMENKALLFSTIKVVRRLTLFFLTISILLIFEKSFKAIILSSVITEFLQAIYLLLITRKKWSLYGEIDKDILKKVLKYSLPLLSANLISLAYGATDKLVLRSLNDFNGIGLYSGASKIVNVVSIFSSSIKNYWMPAVLKWHKEGNERPRIIKSSQIISFFMVTLVFLLILFRKVIILFLGSRYSESMQFLPFLLCVPVLSIISFLAGVGIYIEKKTQYILYINIISFATNLGLNILLISHIGIIGCAIATAIASTVQFIMYVIMSQKANYNLFTKYHFASVTLVLISAFFSLLPIQIHTWITALIFCIFIILSLDIFKFLLPTIKELFQLKKK